MGRQVGSDGPPWPGSDGPPGNDVARYEGAPLKVGLMGRQLGSDGPPGNDGPTGNDGPPGIRNDGPLARPNIILRRHS